jgi:hypothetical protein
MADKITYLWIPRQDGSKALVELRRSSFPSADAYQDAVDFHLERGAEESPPLVPITCVPEQLSA